MKLDKTLTFRDHQWKRVVVRSIDAIDIGTFQAAMGFRFGFTFSLQEILYRIHGLYTLRNFVHLNFRDTIFLNEEKMNRIIFVLAHLGHEFLVFIQMLDVILQRRWRIHRDILRILCVFFFIFIPRFVWRSIILQLTSKDKT